MRNVVSFFKCSLNSGALSKSFLVVTCISTGLVLGLGIFIFVYAKGYSYLTNDPKACANCHVMQDYYDSWVKSTHHQAASCNDCHLPHPIIEKYLAKGRNGFNHSKAFTLQNFPEPIRITKANLDSLQHNCIECHSTMVSGIAAHQDVGNGQARCTQCHRSTGHMHLD
ncbi:MAG: cytochrome c nitrite reductase small subunit [Candidatus Omnitrophica bacterium]|nr:cytochrome c nitrite reductase small subunit [Candidatus Omnitrophota bacterium]